MLNRRQTLTGAAAIAGVLACGASAAPADGFISLADDGEHMTCPMPPGETVVDVRLRDGRIMQAFYDHNIMEAGDWDFVPVGPDGEPNIEADSVADQVTAWRRQA
jgi:hypothetical protein